MSRNRLLAGIFVLVGLLGVTGGIFLSGGLFGKVFESRLLEALESPPPGVEVSWTGLERDGMQITLQGLVYRDRNTGLGLDSDRVSITAGLLDGGRLNACMDQADLILDPVPAPSGLDPDDPLRIHYDRLCVGGLDPDVPVAANGAVDVQSPEFWSRFSLGPVEADGMTILRPWSEGEVMTVQSFGFAGLSEGTVTGFQARGLRVKDPSKSLVTMETLGIRSFHIEGLARPPFEIPDDPLDTLERVTFKGMAMTGVSVSSPDQSSHWTFGSMDVDRLGGGIYGPMEVRNVTFDEDGIRRFSLGRGLLGPVDLAVMLDALENHHSYEQGINRFFGLSSLTLEGITVDSGFGSSTIARISLADVHRLKSGVVTGFTFELDKAVVLAASLRKTPLSFLLETGNRDTLEMSGKLAIRGADTLDAVRIDPLRLDLGDIGAIEFRLSTTFPALDPDDMPRLIDLAEELRLVSGSVQLTGSSGTASLLANVLPDKAHARGGYQALVDMFVRPALSRGLDPRLADEICKNLAAFLEKPGRLSLKLEATQDPPPAIEALKLLEKGRFPTFYRITTDYSR